jgi:F-type H+-transporting ATPase subunit epsilon
MKLSLLTPEKKIVMSQDVEDVLVPGHKGELHILPGHAPLMTLLSTGIMRWRMKGSTEYSKMVVSWGYCEVNPEGVIVLAENSFANEEIDAESFRTEITTLETKLVSESLDEEKWKETQRRLAQLKAGLELQAQK